MRTRQWLALLTGATSIALLLLLCLWLAGWPSPDSGTWHWHRVPATLRWDALATVDLTSPQLYSQDCLRLPLPDENCPVFYRCPSLPAVSYCLNPRLADLTAGDFNFAYVDSQGRPALWPYRLQPLHLNVFLLEDAYLGGGGQVVSRAGATFTHGGCGGADTGAHPVLLEGARVRGYPRLLSLVDPLPQPQRGHQLLHHLPLLVQVRKLLEQVPGLRIALPAEGADQLDLALQILGLDIPPAAFLFLAPADFIHGHQVFVPAKPPCAVPSASAWRAFRDFYFYRSPLAPTTPPPAAQPTVAPPRTVVVLQDGLEGPETLAGHLETALGVRTVLVRGAESLKALVEHLRVADAVVGVSAVGAFDLVIFAPRKAVVVEVVPEQEDHGRAGAHLCRALGLPHRALEGTPTAAGNLHVAPARVAALLKEGS